MVSSDAIDAALEDLRLLCAGQRLRGVGVTAADLDLCLFLADRPHPDLNALRIATGPGPRARFGLETLRLQKADYLDGETSRIIADEIAEAEIRSFERLAPERRVCITLETASGERRLLIEPFGGRGNWFLVDAGDRILCLARRPGGERGELAVGKRYRPPAVAKPDDRVERAPSAAASTEPAAASQSEAIARMLEHARHHGRLERERVVRELAKSLRQRLDREQKGLSSRRRGLEQRQSAEGRIEGLRREAELLMASPKVRERGIEALDVQDWYADGAVLSLELDPRKTVRENAEQRFARARSLERGAAETVAQLADVDAKLDNIEALRAEVDAAESNEDVDALTVLRSPVEASTRAKQGAQSRRKKIEARKPYHEFVSADGIPIWVGRTRQDNDALTLRLARGNDVWLHAGAGLAGSHVVVRLDRGKTAPLETLLDAGTLALHFSKARGRPRGDVLYTQRKHVRKPKGFAPGQVEVLRSKTLQITVEKERLARLLG